MIGVAVLFSEGHEIFPVYSKKPGDAHFDNLLYIQTIGDQ